MANKILNYLNAKWIEVEARGIAYSISGFREKEIDNVSPEKLERRIEESYEIIKILNQEAREKKVEDCPNVRKALKKMGEAHLKLCEYYEYERGPPSSNYILRKIKQSIASLDEN